MQLRHGSLHVVPNIVNAAFLSLVPIVPALLGHLAISAGMFCVYMVSFNSKS
jgi:hypothetical protein